MTLNELHVLNLAIDDRPMVSIPGWDKVDLSPLLVDSVKESLIEKGLFANMHSLTSEGAKIAKRILDYKNAYKYVKTGVVTVAFVNENSGISVVRYPGGDLDIYRVDITHFIDSLMQSHPFFDEEPGEPFDEGMAMSFDKLASEHVLNHNNSVYIATLRLVTEEGKAVLTNDYFFYNCGQHYYYNRYKQMLYKVAPTNIRELLAEKVGL